jgi:quercetin dioxygenase-like cupin family protein
VTSRSTSAAGATSSGAFVRSRDTAWETVGDGVRRQILGHGPDLMMVRVEFRKGAVGTMHHHPHRQVTYVASGSFEATIDGRTMTLGPGDCFYVAAGLPHGAVAKEDGTLIDVFTPAREEFLRPAAAPVEP